MANDPSHPQQDLPSASQVPVESPDSSDMPDSSDTASENSSSKPRKESRILIGSQRGKEGELREKPPERDWVPVVEKTVASPAPPQTAPAPPQASLAPPQAKSPQPETSPEEKSTTYTGQTASPAEEPDSHAPVSEPPSPVIQPASQDRAPVESPPAKPSAEPSVAPSAESLAEVPEAAEPSSEELPAKPEAGYPPPPPRSGRVPVPNLRRDLSDDLMQEFEEAMGTVEMDAIVEGSDRVAKQAVFETESQHHGTVLSISSEDVFVDLGGREQGTVPVRQFAELPEVGAELDVIVTGFNAEEGLYDLMIPNAAASVENWDDLRDGITVEAMVTGHNSGGLECEVNHIRGFIPVSQISLYRVEDLEQFVGERFTCLVTEANRERRNLVLSRRAVLEREKEEARAQLLESLEPGQIHEGVVRKLMDFGAFVDIGGVDGLVHISQLDWGRIEHPSEILEEGQTIKVRILKVDPSGNRISLGYRDMLENPWESVDSKYPVGATVTGKVAKIMEFGAFVQLERGVEGLVHISEIAHKTGVSRIRLPQRGRGGFVRRQIGGIGRTNGSAFQLRTPSSRRLKKKMKTKKRKTSPRFRRRFIRRSPSRAAWNVAATTETGLD